jgi:predicted dehydrogenase
MAKEDDVSLRVGIISAAWGVQAHLPAWRAVPGVEVVGICTAHRETAEAAATEHGIAMPFWDASEMSRHPDIDVIDVGTRPSYRREMCLAALGAGKHVYNGIPFAADIEAARELRDAAAEAGTVTAVDAYSEHFGVFRFAEELLAEGTLGTVQSVVGRLELSLFAQPLSNFPYNWFHDATFGASALRNLGSHLLHLMVFLVGPVAEVAGAPAQFLGRWDFTDAPGGLDVDVADTAVASLRFERGPLGMLSVAWAGAAAPGFHLELAGERGRLVMTAPMMPAGESTVFLGRVGGALEPVSVPQRLQGTEGVDMPSAWPGDPRGAMARSFWLMTKAIAGEDEARPDFARSYHVQSVIEAVHRSGEGAGWVRPHEL